MITIIIIIITDNNLIPNSKNITSITMTQLINSQQQDISIKPVYQFVQLKIKPSKKEWNSLTVD